MTSSNGNIFRVTGYLCGEFPTQKQVTRSFDVSFDLLLNKRLSKKSWGWWFGTLLHPLWRHCNTFCCFSSPVKQHRVWNVLTPLFIIISVFTIHRKYFFFSFFFMLGFQMYYPHYLLSSPFSQFIANNVFFFFFMLDMFDYNQNVPTNKYLTSATPSPDEEDNTINMLTE